MRNDIVTEGFVFNRSGVEATYLKAFSRWSNFDTVTINVYKVASVNMWP